MSMKKCSRCSKPATLHITEVRENSVEEELHLCESCAHQYIKTEEGSDGDEEGFAVKLPEVTGEGELEELDQLVCPNCGITFREFRSHGRLGCPQEYIAFSRELMPLLEQIHGETQHAGKIPKRAPDASQRQYRLIKMRNQLRSAVDDEQYEEAARLRDEIQTLEAELDQDQDES